jgi:hypothetical protein
MQERRVSADVNSRSDASRSNAWFSALAGIGAFWLVGGLLGGLGVVLLWVGVFHRESGPPRLEPTLLPAALIASFVAVRLGGWRAYLVLLAFASLGFIRAVSYPIGAAIDCSHGDTDACRGATDLDFVIPQAWLVPGLLGGALAAALIRGRVPLRVELEALSPFALAQAIYIFAPMLVGYPGPTAFEIVVSTVAVVVAAYLLARRSPHPSRSAVIVAGGLILLSVPWVIYALWFNRDPEFGLLDRWPSFAAPILLVAAANGFSKLTRDDRPWSATTRLAP